MKRFRKFVSLLTAAGLLALLPGSASLTVRADDPVTYSVKFTSGETNCWCYVTGSTFDENAIRLETKYLVDILKDGDTVVVYSGDMAPDKALDLGTARLANLTVHQNVSAVIHTGGVQDCYVLAGNYSAISGDIVNAYLYDKVTCTFNGNVSEMTLYVEGDPTSSITCSGTVGHFFCGIPFRTYFQMYNVAEGKFNIANGYSQIPDWEYSSTPPEETTPTPEQPPVTDQQPAPAESPAPDQSGSASTPAAPPASTPSADSEYDAVPKTGQNYLYLWLLGISALSFAGSIILKKTEKHN